MVHNVHAIEALLPDGTPATFGPLSADNNLALGKANSLVEQMLALGTREADEIDARFPKLLRRVGGYNINELTLENPNLARLLVGSEGTLAWFQRIHLDLSPIPAHRSLGVCHFPTFYQAMEATQQLVKLDPSAVELVDRTMINLAREIPMFKSTVDQFVVRITAG